MVARKYVKILRIALVFLIFAALLAGRAMAKETLTYERMWPALNQLWRFIQPQDVAVDDAGHIYIADPGSHSVQKFTSDGQLISRWTDTGKKGEENLLPAGLAVEGERHVYIADSANHCIYKFTTDGVLVATWRKPTEKDDQIWTPMDVAVDPRGYVYVADVGNHRILKFTSAGELIGHWGSLGQGEGRFDTPSGLAVDMNGEVYVADTGNHRIQMFTPDGKFLNLWGTRGPDDGQFDHPLRLTVDSRGRLYVADSGNDRIQLFTSTGKFIVRLGRSGNANGQLKSPAGVATGKRGRVYVADSNNGRVQVFDPKGQYVTHWALSGSEKGSFNSPNGIALGTGGNIFIVDRGNHRIQIFSPEGRFLGARGSRGDKEWQFESPRDLAFSPRGLLYVADTANHRIQAFTPKGDYVAQWGGKGSDKGQFNLPSSIAVAGDGSVYVSDSGNHRIQKFDPQGKFVTQWGEPGKGRGQFKLPSGIAVHANGNVYVADTGNHRIQAFNPAGKFIHAWGSYGQGRNEFIAPEGLAVDKRGNVLVADTGNDRVQRFSAQGEFMAAWGQSGGSPGELNRPVALAVRPDGRLYVSDQSNHRIQLFAETAPMTNQKMIIVAGGGPFAGNNLWDATQACANFAYLAATFQGFSRETIHYLSANATFDLDGNGHLDDVDDDARSSNLQNAIMQWAVDADSLVLYLVDHGGPGTFRMSGSEILNVGDLAKWLDQLQQKIAGRIIVIYDACESGSFLSALRPAAGAKRIVIASTSPGEEAQFVSQGTVSFSNFFWNHIFNGADVKDAFKWARDAIGYVPMAQHALLDANGNGTGNEGVDLTLSRNVYIGNATGYFGNAPNIAGVSPDQTITGTNLARLYADGVTDPDGVARVWAVIRPPGYRVSNTTNPLQAFPSVDLAATVGNRYEATFAGFNIEGTHYISVFARDRIGYTSRPHFTSVSVESPLRRRAVIVAGGGAADSNWPSIESNLRLGVQALKFQGYTDDDIFLMSPAAVAGVNLPAASPTLGNLAKAFTLWAAEKTQDLVVYLIGPGGVQYFKLNANEMLWAHHLDSWLDNLQNLIPGALTVIYDAAHGGSFLPLLKPGAGKERILISSTSNQQASFASGGDLSFSAFFWREVFNGANVRDAFRAAAAAIGYAGSGQSALLDDNGNGIGNEAGRDGRLAKTYTIGFGIRLFGDAPVIGTITPGITLTGQNSAQLWVDDVTSTGSIDSVWAVITPPDLTPEDDLPVVTLSPTGNGRYEGVYSNFVRFGLYRVAVYAMDANNSLSLQKETTVRQTIGPDIYEIDDSFDRARVITLNGALPQQHNFHDDGDQDWVRLYGVAGQVYEIRVSGVGVATDPVIELYGSDGTTLLEGPRSAGLEGDDELMIWTCTASGIYYVRIFYKNAGGFGKNAGYDLEIYRPVQTGTGVIKGYINDATNPAKAVVDAAIVTDGGGSAISLPPQGSYLMTHPAGTSWTVTASKYGTHHALSHFPVEVEDLGAITPLDFLLAPIDTDADGLPDHIENAIACLDVTDADTDEDGIVDGDEDKNKNGVQDAGETDPCKPDTDGDLIQDGTELGLTLSDIGPGTNSAVFQPDADSSTKTDPTDDDTDNDRQPDGQEDKNRNGRVDAGETDPNRFNARSLSHLLLLLLQD